MAIEDTEEIDEISFEDEGRTCVLWMLDDWEWNPGDERVAYDRDGEERVTVHDLVHIMFLFDKWLTYKIALRDGDILEDDDPEPERYVFRLVSAFWPDERGNWFLPTLRYGCRTFGMEFQHVDVESLRESGSRSASELLASHGLADFETQRGRCGEVSKTADEIKAENMVWPTEFPPDLYRLIGPAATPDGHGYTMNEGDVVGIVVRDQPLRVEMTILDEYDWNDDGEFDPSRFDEWTDELVSRHDFQHMQFIWGMFRTALICWRWRQIPGLEPDDFDARLTFKVRTTFSPSERGKWFYDWLRQFLDILEIRLVLELDDTEEAHRLRQDALRQ